MAIEFRVHMLLVGLRKHDIFELQHVGPDDPVLDNLSLGIGLSAPNTFALAGRCPGTSAQYAYGSPSDFRIARSR